MMIRNVDLNDSKRKNKYIELPTAQKQFFSNKRKAKGLRLYIWDLKMWPQIKDGCKADGPQVAFYSVARPYRLARIVPFSFAWKMKLTHSAMCTYTGKKI